MVVCSNIKEETSENKKDTANLFWQLITDMLTDILFIEYLIVERQLRV